MVYLYALDVMTLDHDLDAYRDVIPESRLEQLRKRPPADQLRGLGAELLFQRAAWRHNRDLPLPAVRESDSYGKPYLPARPDFYFNLSHSGQWAVCAVADVPVGVDIQQTRAVSMALEKKFTAAEQAELNALPALQRADRFFQLWVLKEAYAKCTGTGLLCPFRSFEAVSPAPGYSAGLVEFSFGNYHLAVCVQAEELPDVRFMIMPV
ncbi:MAG: 4'-phosphopantetheinyl transferase superfamily protein [Oscillospiraceae bacterium]|nr:4'-phosphopantetheinyl transferase superfamily protein [Oscillospiraceae bacterium]